MSQKIPKTVLVTGANGSLGQSVLNIFSENGCKLVGVDFSDLSSKKDLKGMSFYRCNLSDSSQVNQVVREISKSHDIDAVVHCAGGFRFSTVDSFKDEDFEFLFNANVRSSFLLARAVLPLMKKKEFGRLVFVSALATLTPGAGMGPYAASKAGVNSLTQSLSQEVKDLNITVNAVLPSILDTPANRNDMPDADFSKWVSLEQISKVIFELTQPHFTCVTGALLPVSGKV